MLLGPATILAGLISANDPVVSQPRVVGLILLFCFFTLAWINRDIESGHIARGQAELLVYTDNYVERFNGTCFLSSPEHGSGGLLVVSFLTSVAIGMALELGQLLLNHVCCKCCPCHDDDAITDAPAGVVVAQPAA